jgi:choline-sulfatase
MKTCIATLVFAAFIANATAAAQTPVILISIDTLRADHLGAYGYKAISTPNIDAFAQHGTLFTDASSQVPLTLPSHTSLLTSTYPFQSGIEENGQTVPTTAVTLATVLQAHGYKTAAFIGSVLLDKSAGLTRGFDEYDSPFSAPTASESPYASRVRRDGALVLRAATQWLAAHQGQPVFAFIHLFDLHAPYKVHPTIGSALPEKAGYDAEIEYVDRILGRFLQSEIAQRALVVLISDHGESLGDHGETSHGYFAYQATLHVPLIIHWPTGSPAYPPRVTTPVALLDVAPTILDALHLPAQPAFEGVSLMSPTPQHAIYAESVYARDQFGWAPLHTLRVGQFKFIDAPRAELYDLGKDPAEATNLARTNAAEVTTLRTELTRLRSRYTAAKPQQPAPDKREALRSLGYLSGNNVASTNAPDPKDRIAEYQLFEKALDDYYANRIEAAIANLRRVIAKDPANKPAAAALAEFQKR